ADPPVVRGATADPLDLRVFAGNLLLHRTEFALEICEAVAEAWQPDAQRPLILNLPATVEVSLPNVYADQIEWFCRRFGAREAVTISVHPHNDRGTGVACAEQAQLAGAQRVEGCLFGNGERTGNVDLVTLAMNLYTQGIDPGLDFSDMREVVRLAEACNQLPVHPRHPYAGELVFTAFSGSHQDAIKKGFAAQAERSDGRWCVPYLPLDPADVGCSYEAVIRVNSQSGKGGIAWLLEQDHGLRLPRRLQMEFSRIVQLRADETGREQSSAQLWQLFRQTYGLHGQAELSLLDYRISGSGDADRLHGFSGQVRRRDEVITLQGQGNGALSAAVDALRGAFDLQLEILDYQEHSLGRETASRAVSYVECRGPEGRSLFGVGIDSDATASAIRALISATARLLPLSSSAPCAGVSPKYWLGGPPRVRRNMALKALRPAEPRSSATSMIGCPAASASRPASRRARCSHWLKRSPVSRWNCRVRVRPLIPSRSALRCRLQSSAGRRRMVRHSSASAGSIGSGTCSARIGSTRSSSRISSMIRSSRPPGG